MGIAKGRPVLVACLVCMLACCMTLLAGCGGPSAEEVIREQLTQELDKLKGGEVEDFVKGVEGSAADSFDALGVDAKEYAKLYLDGFSYEIGDIELNDAKDEATASVTLKIKSMTEIVNAFADEYAKQVGAMDSWPTQDELMQLGGDILTQVTKAAETKEVTVKLKFVQKDGSWEPDSDSVTKIGRAHV